MVTSRAPDKVPVPLFPVKLDYASLETYRESLSGYYGKAYSGWGFGTKADWKPAETFKNHLQLEDILDVNPETQPAQRGRGRQKFGSYLYARNILLRVQTPRDADHQDLYCMHCFDEPFEKRLPGHWRLRARNTNDSCMHEHMRAYHKDLPHSWLDENKCRVRDMGRVTLDVSSEIATPE
jgi:hypothetical protein